MSPASRVLSWLVRAYQLVVSPWVVQQCKYYPSCSAYALTAVQTHGAVRGMRLAIWRLLRCNPWSRGGVDHVPARPTVRPLHAQDLADRGPTPISPARS